MKAEAIMRNIGAALKKRSPEILTAVGIGGMITSVIFAVKATPKAMKLIEERKEAAGADSLGVKETVRTAWKCYIPTAVTCAASAACVIFAQCEGARRSAALAAAYTASEEAYRIYREKTEETVGEEKAKEIRSAANKETLAANPPDKTVVFTGNGEQLCFDPLSGRYFESSVEDIRKAVNEVNHRMLSEMCVSLNDLYYELGLDGITVGDMLGWHVDGGCFDVKFDAQLSPENVPCVVIEYTVAPKYSFDMPF